MPPAWSGGVRSKSRYVHVVFLRTNFVTTPAAAPENESLSVWFLADTKLYRVMEASMPRCLVGEAVLTAVTDHVDSKVITDVVTVIDGLNPNTFHMAPLEVVSINTLQWCEKYVKPNRI